MLRFFRLINQNCRLATRLVSDSLERSLAPLERAGLRIHLLGCRSCRRYQRQIRMIDQLVASRCDLADDQPALPAEIRERIREKLSGPV